jgi:chitodextrinase
LKLTTTHPQKGIGFVWVGPNGFTSTEQNPTITNMTPGNAGDYSVATIVNGCTSSFTSTKVMVGSVPSAILSGGNITNCGTSPVNLSVTLNGAPPFSYGYSVNNGAPIVVTGVTASPSVLEVVPPGPGIWNYTLLWVTDATGCRGGIATGNATVQVTGDLQLQVARLIGLGCNGGNAIITLRATGGTGNYRYTLNGVSNNTGTFAGIEPGEYVATVTDGNCTAATVISVASLGTPTIVSFETEPSTAQNQVVVSWEPVSGAAAYSLSYRTAGSNREWVVLEGISGNSATINGLEPGTNYEFRVRAICEGGRGSEWSLPRIHQTSSGCLSPIRIGLRSSSAVSCANNGGEIIAVASGGSSSNYLYSLNNGPFDNTTGIFTGLAAGSYLITVRQGDCVASSVFEVAPLTAPSFTSTSASATSMTLSWSSVPGAASYTLRYRVLGSNIWNEIGNQSSPATVSNLAPSTTYEFSVNAVCPSGITSNWSNPIGLPTNADNNCGAPRGVSITNVSATTATVNWSAPATSGVCYVLSFGPMSSDPATWQNLLLPFGASSANLSGLMPGVPYGVIMRTNCALCSATSGTRSAPSDLAAFTTSARQGAIGAESLELQVYPNPSNGQFSLDMNLPQGEITSLQITDMGGRVIFERQFEAEEGKVVMPIDLSESGSGIYLLRLRYGYHSQSVKVIVN